MVGDYQDGVVYFVLDELSGLIKIGHTIGNPWARLESGGLFNPNPIRLLGVVDGGSRDETTLHKLFAAHHVRREWFRGAPAIYEYIASACAMPKREPVTGCVYCNGGKAAPYMKPCRVHRTWHRVITTNKPIR